MKIFNILSVLLITLGSGSLFAAAPHSVIGTLQYEDESFPQDIYWTAYITTRPEDVLVFEQPTTSMYDQTTGNFLIQCSALSSWAADETLHVEFTDTQDFAATLDVVLSYDAYDNAGIVVLNQVQEAEHPVYGFVQYVNEAIPAAINWTAFITTRPDDTLAFTDSSYYDNTTGEFVLECTDFSSWTAGDTLHIDIDDTQSATGFVELILTEQISDSTDVVTLEYPVGIVSDQLSAPQDIRLMQNYPNPFNPETVISFGLDRSQYVKLTVYNTLGKRVRTLIAEYKNVGEYKTVWDGKNDAGDKLGSGTYFLELKGETLTRRSKAIMIR